MRTLARELGRHRALRHGHRLVGLRPASRSAIRWTAWGRWCRRSSRARSWRAASAARSIRTGRRRGRCLLRVFVGGARRPELAEMPDERTPPAGHRPDGEALGDPRRADLLRHRPLAADDAAVSRRPQGSWSRGSRPGRRPCPTFNWPATPITAWACPTASTAGELAAERLLASLAAAGR